MRRVTEILVALGFLCLGLFLAYRGLFATVKMPNAAGKALVFKPFSRDSLRGGNLILVEFSAGEQKSREVRQFLRVEIPDKPKVGTGGGRHGLSQEIAQALIDMDYANAYYISPEDISDTNNLVRITEHQIKGKVIHVFKP